MFKSSFRYLRLLVHNTPTYWDSSLLVGGVLAAIAAGIPFPLLGLLFGELVDELNGTTCNASHQIDANVIQSSVNQKVLLVVYITIANFLAIYIHTGCWGLFGERLVRRMRTHYFKSLLRQEITFFDGLSAGEVSVRLTTDIEIIRSGTSEKVGICISSFSYLVGAYIVAFIKAPKLAGMLVALVPAYVLMAVIGGVVGKYTGRMTDHVGSAISVASQALSNVRLVHAFGASSRLEARYASHLEGSQSNGLKKAAVVAVQFGLLFFIAYSANAVAFWQGGHAIAASAESDKPVVTAGAVYTVIFLLIDGMCLLDSRCVSLRLMYKSFFHC